MINIGWNIDSSVKKVMALGVCENIGDTNDERQSDATMMQSEVS